MHREYNTEADAAAGLHVLKFFFDPSCLGRHKCWKVQFDGSFSEESSGAGWVVWSRLDITQDFAQALIVSLPVSARSSVQAELMAAVLAVGSTHLMQLGADAALALSELSQRLPTVKTLPAWWVDNVLRAST